ncbi:lytic transglycosylase domain-containing protein [Herbaspirillum lusitanum]|uniref:lytic transglycosylase domain-containing protein n=1 Tax=Herbaspirillum lusitanum TaxID=213312 RepID=UPI002238B142|nr:lytic transglycosylase domain-containing protein [Herbaspirillum lusitanum]MCW5296794.1 lytic transglycosylase domain-containing protein [Herbaspirillum lusitanum]
MRFFRLTLTLMLACGLQWFVAVAAHAGNQQEEQLADSLRSLLTQAVADARPPKPQFSTIEERIAYLNWLGEMSDRLREIVPDRRGRLELLESAWYEARRAGLDPALVLGLIQVESAFRKYAISSAGATGYMQVMPFWTRVIGDGDRRKLFHMRSNLRYGCVILRLYLDQEGGDYFMALGRYNGSRGQAEYPNAVLSAWKHWEYGNSAGQKGEGSSAATVVR